MKNIANLKGFTLLETLIAFIVLTIGLLGAIALQASAKKASYDSLQRSAALALGNDIIQRIRANDTVNVVTAYNKTITSEDEISSVTTCFNSTCSDVQIAAFDLEEWKKAIKAQNNTGGLADATVCIRPTLSLGNEVDLQVIVTWEGRQEISQITANNAINCGTSNNKRRMLVLNSFVALRS